MKLRVYFLAWLFLLPSVLAQEQGIVSSTLQFIFGALGDELIVRFLFFIILAVILKELAQRTELLPGKTGGIVAVIVSLIGMRFMPAPMLLTLKGFIVVVAALAFPYFILSMIFKNKKIALGISAALILVLALYLVFTPPTSVSSSGGYSRYGIEAYEDAKFFGINVPLHGISDLISTVLYFFKAYAIYLGALAVLLLLIVFWRSQRGKIPPGTTSIGEHLREKGRASKDRSDLESAAKEQHKRELEKIGHKHKLKEESGRLKHELAEKAARAVHERELKKQKAQKKAQLKELKEQERTAGPRRSFLSKLFRRKQSGEEEKREEQVEEKQHDTHVRAYQEAQRRAAEEERLRLAEERAEEKQIESARKALRRKYSWRKFKNLFKKDEEEEEIPVPKKEGAFSLLKSALRIESKERIADWKEERRLKQKAKEWQEQQRRMAEENVNLVLKEAEEKQRQAAIMKEYEARIRDQRERELEAEKERRELEKRKMNLLHFGPNQQQEQAREQRVEEQNRINEARDELRKKYAQRKGIKNEYEAILRDQRERELEAEREKKELEKRKMNLLHFGPNQQEQARQQGVEDQNRINEARDELRRRYAQRKGIPLRESEEEQRVEKYIPEKRGLLSKLKSILRLEQQERQKEEEERQRLELAAKQWREQQTLMAEHTAEQTIKEEEERKAAEVRKEFEERQRLEVERNREERRKLRDLARRKKRILNQK